MYIKKIIIKGFRNYVDNEVEFHEGINVLIGHNNSGKSNLLRAMQLVLEPHCRTRKLRSSDFSRNINIALLKSQAPKVEISVTLAKSEEDEQQDDLPMVATWLTKM
ncbi:MAG: AAA family ATPase, partial [Paraprevotella sp.]|nr:AAA family ATPase [Paraprevotella sp.]